MPGILRPAVTGILALCALANAQTPSRWRYDLRAGDRLVYTYTFRKQVGSEEAETVIEARFHTQVLIAGVHEGVISAGFQRNRDSAQLVSYRVKGKDKLAEERPNFEKRMRVRPSQFSEAMEFNTVGEPRYSWEVARETPSHILPALHEIEVLPLNPPKSGNRWDAMNMLGMNFEMTGSESIHGRNCYRVKGASGDGSVTITYWWSPESGVLERVELEGTYPIAGGTSHELASMELEARSRNESLSDWLTKPESRLAALETLLLSPSVPATADQLTAALAEATPNSQRLTLAVTRRRGIKLDASKLNELSASADAEMKAMAARLLGSTPEKPPQQECALPASHKADPPKFGTLFRAALPDKPGPAVPYFLRVPLSYRGDHPTPLLVYLSGGPGLALDGVNTANDAVASTGYLVLYPQAGEYWWKPEVAQRLDTALRDVFREFNVDRDRVYIAGFSNGGTGALYMAELWPQRFAAVVSLMGAGLCMDEVHNMLPNLANVPLLFVHGEKDARISPTCSTTTYDAIRELRPATAPQFRMLPGRDHDITLASDDGFTLEYLKDKTRDAFPKRVNAQVPDAAFPRQYWVEVLEKKPGIAEVRAEIRQDNVIEIRSREVKKLRLYLRAEMFAQAGPVRVRWNAKQVFEGAVQGPCVAQVNQNVGDWKFDLADQKEFAIP